MAEIVYTNAESRIEVDVRELPNGKFQGIVLIVRNDGRPHDEAPHIVPIECDTPREALEEGKALAHRLVAR